MELELEREVIDTAAGEYTVRWIYDEDAGQPYDSGFGLVKIGEHHRRFDITTDAEHADEVADTVRYHRKGNAYDGNIWDREVRSSAAIARWLRLKFGLKGIVVIDDSFRPSEPTADRGEDFAGLAWAPDDATDPDAYTRTMLAEWRAWAEGDTFGWVVTDPSGHELEDGSVWGYYGLDANRQYTRDYAVEVIDADVTARVSQCNLVGAGIVGLI